MMPGLKSRAKSLQSAYLPEQSRPYSNFTAQAAGLFLIPLLEHLITCNILALLTISD